MNCRICGAELKREGELCNNCMNKLMEQQRLRNDVEKTYTFKQKFILGYELLRHIEQVGVLIFTIILILSVNIIYWRYAVLIGCIFGIAGILYLLHEERILNSGICTLYSHRLVYTKGTFRKKTKQVSFSEIEDISYQQGSVQKPFNVGNIIIKKKTRNILDKFIIIESVKDIEKVFENIKVVFENNEVGR